MDERRLEKRLSDEVGLRLGERLHDVHLQLLGSLGREPEIKN
jgi:hypothetical protein